MRLIYLIVIIFLLTSFGAAQLSLDKERFDVVIHPGELEERTLKLTNIGDVPIFEITSTQVTGNAKDLIFLAMPEDKVLQPSDEAEIHIFFAISPEAKPGVYTGYVYLLESTPPTMPIRIEFNIDVVGQESYGLGMTIDDAKSDFIYAKAEEIAEFDLAVKNLGVFRDVASINTSLMPEGWTVTLVEGEKELSMPYDVPLAPGATHSMKLLVETSKPGKKNNLVITASSLGNRSINTSVDATVEFGLAVRGYNVDIEAPDTMVVNKTYKGTFSIGLDVTEKVLVGIVTPSELMVIPLAQVIEVTPKNPGVANFTMLASKPGNYPLIFKLMDSNGIPMPEEATSIDVILPEGLAVLTGEDFLYSTIASLSVHENGALAAFNIPSGKLDEKTKERLQDYSRVVILGDQSIVSEDAKKALEGIEIKRIQGENLCIECWLFAAEMWQNGSSEAVLSSPQPVDIFRAYQLAKTESVPLVICKGSVNEAAKSAIIEMTKRNVTLSKALIVGEIGDDNAKALQDAGILMEKVT